MIILLYFEPLDLAIYYVIIGGLKINLLLINKLIFITRLIRPVTYYHLSGGQVIGKKYDFNESTHFYNGGY